MRYAVFLMGAPRSRPHAGQLGQELGPAAALPCPYERRRGAALRSLSSRWP